MANNSVFLSWWNSQVIVGPLSIQGNINPSADNTYDLGASSLRWRSVYVGTSFLAPDGTAAAPSVAFASQIGLGFYKTGTNEIGFASNAWSTTGPVIDFSGSATGGGMYVNNAATIGWSATTNPFTGTADINLRRIAAGQLGIQKDSTHGVTLDVGTDSTLKVFARDGSSAATLQTASIKMTTATAFASGDKYVIIDASGNLHVSALGPAS